VNVFLSPNLLPIEIVQQREQRANGFFTERRGGRRGSGT
jgi:hypothetical protein